MVCLSVGTFVFVDAKVYKNKVFKKPVIVKKTLKLIKNVTIGTKNNLGNLFIKGEVSNLVKGEKVVVNDDLSVKKDLSIYGNLKVYGHFEKVNVINIEDLADES